MRLRTLSPALAYKTEQAPQCLVSTLYFWSAMHDIFIKCNHVWSSFIESVLWCTTCIMTSSSQSLSLGWLVMWYSMPPIYIYCHHSFHEELQKFKYHYQWHMCQCHFPKLVCRGHVGQQIQYTDWQNTAWRIQLVLATYCWIWSAHL